MADTMRLDVLSETLPIRLPTLDPSAVQWFEAGAASAEADWADARQLPTWHAVARLSVALAGCAAAVMLLAAVAY